eukprot:scaffold59948_cov60-Phaeocystis_antarctica.AAC.3
MANVALLIKGAVAHLMREGSVPATPTLEAAERAAGQRLRAIRAGLPAIALDGPLLSGGIITCAACA